MTMIFQDEDENENLMKSCRGSVEPFLIETHMVSVLLVTQHLNVPQFKEKDKYSCYFSDNFKFYFYYFMPYFMFYN